jgi:hypothetical protein
MAWRAKRAAARERAAFDRSMRRTEAEFRRQIVALEQDITLLDAAFPGLEAERAAASPALEAERLAGLVRLGITSPRLERPDALGRTTPGMSLPFRIAGYLLLLVFWTTPIWSVALAMHGHLIVGIILGNGWLLFVISIAIGTYYQMKARRPPITTD